MHHIFTECVCVYVCEYVCALNKSNLRLDLHVHVIHVSSTVGTCM